MEIDLAKEEVIIAFSFTIQKNKMDGERVTLTGSGCLKGFTTEPAPDTAVYLQMLKAPINPF